MISVRIGAAERTVIAAAPDYVARAGSPATPHDLLGHRCLGYRYTSSGAIHRWRFERGGQSVVVDPPACYVSNDVDLVLEAARAGIGIGAFSAPQVARDLASGTLVSLLAPWCPLIPANYLYYPSRRQMSPALRVFIDALRIPSPQRGEPGA